ncbi:hypothetical protein AYI68_g1273 [Smittium mucronatum]|uniref:Uncharacterized protein n=1 Tax=Smittium mucronatum TaxID=133383 RepID=A0A1R0H638_9FUNG|nr:hypothetical protein AYI68_g1273 [Smittium mucronatum]
MINRVWAPLKDVSIYQCYQNEAKRLPLCTSAQNRVLCQPTSNNITTNCTPSNSGSVKNDNSGTRMKCTVLILIIGKASDMQFIELATSSSSMGVSSLENIREWEL